MRAEDRKPSKRVFPLLQNLDLDSVTFDQVQGVGDPISIEDMNEQEMVDLIIVNLARLAVAGEWDGLLTAGGGGAEATCNGMPIVDLDTLSSTGDTYYATVGSPISGGGAGSFALTSSTFYDASWYVPFVGGFSAAIYIFKFNVESAASSANLKVGIYSSSNGLPNALLGTAETVDVTGTGDKEITDPFGGSVTLVEGTLYFVGFVRTVSGDAVTLKATDNPSCGWMPSQTTGQLGSNLIEFDADDLDLPDTITQEGLGFLNRDVVNFMMRPNFS